MRSTAADVVRLRRLLDERGIAHDAHSDDVLSRVLDVVPDTDLAATAISLHLRPAWLADIIGAIPAFRRRTGQAWPDCENLEFSETEAT